MSAVGVADMPLSVVGTLVITVVATGVGTGWRSSRRKHPAEHETQTRMMRRGSALVSILPDQPVLHKIKVFYVLPGKGPQRGWTGERLSVLFSLSSALKQTTNTFLPEDRQRIQENVVVWAAPNCTVMRKYS
jgi:hypothetical protein